jgi:hypothetical protein
LDRYAPISDCVDRFLAEELEGSGVRRRGVARVIHVQMVPGIVGWQKPRRMRRVTQYSIKVHYSVEFTLRGEDPVVRPLSRRIFFRSVKVRRGWTLSDVAKDDHPTFSAMPFHLALLRSQPLFMGPGVPAS